MTFATAGWLVSVLLGFVELLMVFDRPELHAEEMVGLVLQFLTEFSLQNPSVSAGNDDGTVMALSVRSLHQLCSSEVIGKECDEETLNFVITRWLIFQQLGT